MCIYHTHVSCFALWFVPGFRFGPYFVEPIVAGLKEDKTPFISAFDLIGAPVITDDFVVGGTCTNNLYGMCESFYKPNMVRRRGEGPSGRERTGTWCVFSESGGREAGCFRSDVK